MVRISLNREEGVAMGKACCIGGDLGHRALQGGRRGGRALLAAGAPGTRRHHGRPASRAGASQALPSGAGQGRQPLDAVLHRPWTRRALPSAPLARLFCPMPMQSEPLQCRRCALAAPLAQSGRSSYQCTTCM